MHSLSKTEAKVLRHAQMRQRNLTGEHEIVNEEQAFQQMQRTFGFRRLRPQRLFHLGMSEEAKRLLETWQYWDVCLHKTCFADIKELEPLVLDPQKFRKNIQTTVIAMSDQLPLWVKLQPGKQIYAKEECVRKNRKLSGQETSKGGGSQVSSVFDVDGMTQKRGSDNSQQDKYRITVDVEQILRGFFTNGTLVAEWGITSVILGGAQCSSRRVLIYIR